MKFNDPVLRGLDRRIDADRAKRQPDSPRLTDSLPSAAERDALENMRSDLIMGHKIMASDAEVALRVINRFIAACG